MTFVKGAFDVAAPPRIAWHSGGRNLPFVVTGVIDVEGFAVYDEQPDPPDDRSRRDSRGRFALAATVHFDASFRVVQTLGLRSASSSEHDSIAEAAAMVAFEESLR
jgi:hypothetical protein